MTPTAGDAGRIEQPMSDNRLDSAFPSIDAAIKRCRAILDTGDDAAACLRAGRLALASLDYLRAAADGLDAVDLAQLAAPVRAAMERL